MFVLSSELVGPSKRGFCGNIIQAFFAVGIMLFSLTAYWIPNWRILTLASAGFGAFLLITFIWLPESPRWLLANHRTDDAINILQRIAASNGRDLPAHLEVNLRTAHSSQIIKPSSNADRRELFTNPKLCLVTLIQLFSWFVNSIVYYGLTLASAELGANIYISTALSGLVEIPAYIFAAILIERSWFGRRRTLALFMIFGGISCFAFKFVNVKLLALFGKLAIAASFSIIYIQSTELFPTVIRNSGLGLCSCFARIGGIVAPFVSLADSITPDAQFLILGVLSFVSGMLNLYLPETLNKPMPETIQDLEGLLRGYVALDQLEQEHRDDNDDDVDDKDE
jgi:hypothetical protein